jgi:hypothetical protein
MTLEEIYARATPEPNTGCLLWTMATNRDVGYGLFTENRKSQYAHRAAWAAEHGPIPDGKQVLHRCDQPPCVNAEHLFLGTGAENHADKAAKGRSTHGAKSHTAKLTEDQVRAIRRRFAAGESRRMLALAFGASYQSIKALLQGRTWKRTH